TTSRIQSSSVVRGSMRRRWSLPFMRNVIGTAPWMLGRSGTEPVCASVLSECVDEHPAMTAVAAVLPMVHRKSRRVGSGGSNCSWPSMQFPFNQRPMKVSNSLPLPCNTRHPESQPQFWKEFALFQFLVYYSEIQKL